MKLGVKRVSEKVVGTSILFILISMHIVVANDYRDNIIWIEEGYVKDFNGDYGYIGVGEGDIEYFYSENTTSNTFSVLNIKKEYKRKGNIEHN